MVDNMQIAKTILDQLGGNRFKVMTGASNFMAIESGLVFSIKGSRRINKIRIILNHRDDSYRIEFIKIFNVMTRKEPVVVSSYGNVFCDNLCAVFERETGLVTNL